jgi:hypothetical protein
MQVSALPPNFAEALGVTPLGAFAYDSDGMKRFLNNWGGESFYWAGMGSVERAQVLDALSALSEPLIIEVAVRASNLTYQNKLWPIFVAQLAGWGEPWHEFWTDVPVDASRVVDILHRGSDRWPVNVG